MDFTKDELEKYHADKEEISRMKRVHAICRWKAHKKYHHLPDPEYTTKMLDATKEIMAEQIWAENPFMKLLTGDYR